MKAVPIASKALIPRSHPGVHCNEWWQLKFICQPIKKWAQKNNAQKGKTKDPQKLHVLDGRHSSVVTSAPTILRPGFESQAHNLCFFNLHCIVQIENVIDEWEKGENKQTDFACFYLDCCYLCLIFSHLNFLIKLCRLPFAARSNVTSPLQHFHRWWG